MIRYNITLAPGAKLPRRNKPTDSGYDLVALEEPTISGFQHVDGTWGAIYHLQYRTGIKLSDGHRAHLVPWTDKAARFVDSGVARTVVESEWVRDGSVWTLLFPRSSVSNYNLVLANSVAVIDHSYIGELLVRFKYTWQPMDLRMGAQGMSCVINPSRIYHAGDRICQMVPADLMDDVEFKQVEAHEQTARGEGGFGSSGQ